ncbi:MAG: alpha/beta hydrolase [Alphaproteobacteria bacterium]|nr:alpha/beta hydrolase [Alphaproteobacteria bacterium]
MPQSPDDQTKNLLETMAANPGPKLYELPVEAAREMLKVVSKIFELPSCDVGKIEEYPISYDGGEYRVRCYHPPGSDEKIIPATLVYHGGGYMLGDLDTHDTIARYLCLHAGHRIISVDYRLAPEFLFPAGLEDCYHALLWVNERAGELGIDRDNISLVGDSAGGNLCAGVAELSRRRGGPEIASIVMLYPSCDGRIDTDYPSRSLYGNGDYFLGRKDVEWISQNYTKSEDPAENILLSPILNRNFDGWPPTLVVTAGMDILRDEGRAFYQLLCQHEVPTRYHSYDGTVHGFVCFAGALDIGKKCLADVVHYLKSSDRRI